MNIWIKTSASRTNSRATPLNTTLPTITEHRHLTPDQDTQSQDADSSVISDSCLSHLYQRELRPLKADRLLISNQEQIDEGSTSSLHEFSSTHGSNNQAKFTGNSKKSVRFCNDLQKSDILFKSKQPYESYQNNEEDIASQVPSHIILGNDPRLKFKRLKKQQDTSDNKPSTPKESEMKSSSLLLDGSSSTAKAQTFTLQKRSNQNKISSSNNPSSNINSNSNLNSKVVLASSRGRESQYLRTHSHLTKTSNSMAVNYTSDHLQEDDLSVLISKRSIKTTGRKQHIKEHIISIIQYCSNQVGLAIYNVNNGEICLCQIIERLTYFRTISTIERFYPLEILYSTSLEHTPLMKKLNFKFRSTSFKNFKRMLFDETKGFHIYSQRGNKDDYNPDNKFIAYSALNTLIFYLENNYETKFNYNSLSIKWHLIEDLLIIESQTIAELEIFLNADTKNKDNCFVDNFQCLTHGGSRMLRANLLQPLANQKMIKERQDLVSALLQDKTLFELLCSEVSKFKNFQIITAKFIQSPKQKNMKSLKSFISAIFTLSHLCLLLKKFYQKAEIYTSKNYPLLGRLLPLINDHRISQLREFIEEQLDQEILKTYDGSKPTKKQNFIFLFRAEKLENDFIEVLRITYSHTIEDIFRIFRSIKEKSSLDLKLLYSQYRGYYLKSTKKINLTQLSQKIEDDIIQITQKNNSILFSTTILLSLNNRLKESEKKLILLCEGLLQSIITEIQKNTEVLFEINYEMSTLDMILAFVSFVKKYPGISFSKPLIEKNSKQLDVEELKTIWTNEAKFKLSSPISFKIGTHKKTAVILKQPNSFDQLNLLYSIGYLTILAQIGCFVPAAKFSTDLYQTILSKINITETIESGLSHFQSELYHFKSILDNTEHYNSNCLILLDQLIKGTQYEEEISLSLGLLTHLLKVSGKLFVLVSDRFQFHLILKISSAPIPFSEHQDKEEQTVQQIKGKTFEPSVQNKSASNPIHFELTKAQQSLELTLQSLNFCSIFVKNFSNLLVEEEQQANVESDQ